MEQHRCKTYFAVWFDFDEEKNASFLKRRCMCSPEEIGIFRKEEVGRFLAETLGVAPEWRRHHFVVGLNENYAVNVNDMLRVTLQNLFGKEEAIRELCNRFGVTTSLEIVPYLVAGSEEPAPILSLDRDIVAFLYQSGTAMDLDYYVI